MKNPYREVKKATSANKVFQKIETAAPHVLVSFPKELYDKMKDSLAFGQ
jgi:hypothetical protein